MHGSARSRRPGEPPEARQPGNMTTSSSEFRSTGTSTGDSFGDWARALDSLHPAHGHTSSRGAAHEPDFNPEAGVARRGSGGIPIRDSRGLAGGPGPGCSAGSTAGQSCCTWIWRPRTIIRGLVARAPILAALQVNHRPRDGCTISAPQGHGCRRRSQCYQCLGLSRGSSVKLPPASGVTARKSRSSNVSSRLVRKRCARITTERSANPRSRPAYCSSSLATVPCSSAVSPSTRNRPAATSRKNARAATALPRRRMR